MTAILKASRKILLGAVALGVLFGVAKSQAADAPGPYKVQKTWKIGGDGGWDYLVVDSAAKRLYITRGTHVQVVDIESGSVSGDITGFKGVHGVAFDSTGKYGYITDGGSNNVAVFELSVNKVTQTIPAGTNPDGIVFEPKTERIFAFNGRSNNATVIDTHTNKVVETIALPGKPEFPRADGKGTVFVNIEDTSQIARIDAATAKVTALWSIAPCEEPSGMAIDIAHNRLFSVCGNKQMAVVDAASGKVVASPAIGNGPDAAAFDAGHAVAFSSNGEGTLTILSQKSANEYSLLQTLPTKQGARTMALDPTTGTVYTVTADFGPRPAATTENPRPRPQILPDSFVVLVIGR
jgi:YVTN family beta-propeller protein